GARSRVAAYGAGHPIAAVIPDEHGRAERIVDPLHHLERTRKSTHDPHILGQLVNEHALPVSVRVADDDVHRSTGADSGNGGIDLGGHPFARALVLKSVRT